MKTPRVISLVPSWTETLLEAGANVVGRSRFCIHPAAKIAGIPAVGGTKDLKLEAIRALSPDLIILDREENTLAMSEALRDVAPLLVSHVRAVGDMPRELRALAGALGGGSSIGSVSAGVSNGTPTTDKLVSNSQSELLSYADRFQSVLSKLPVRFEFGERVPGEQPLAASGTRKVVYVIWKNPWMAITRETYIGSMLEAVGVDASQIWPVREGSGFAASSGSASAPASAAASYPAFSVDDLPSGSLILLSSEPYPFHKKFFATKAELAGHEVQLVDGESFSWFGIRSLRFLESLSK